MLNNLKSRIYDSDHNMIFTDGRRNPISDITSIVLDEDSRIDHICNIYDQEIREFNYERYVLNVPGVGMVVPGTRVVWKEQDYVLLFGWHKNISNQEIFSWYLRSLEKDVCDKTLYRSMIDEIELVHFR